ncbi:hypothetical protein P3X46_028536 [Hevea brasiliensis]|uniref:Uncharacterized protein n=1 Tax=Hevea brasiliensis TaxID=3981 RepID=A0ABQ9KR43_HEVBR|nr:uncharacterized protein LOC131174548 [Hevea brasiliensis]XP_057994253.1 uncharacterized protein LOC131174563 [Hevea brasiliensis]KAJ9146209.1 hypothetical protein P3X46_028504 [Hevea brasiliensis]KAJ9146247.1 hypothetical protein P3X46_028536 [Hevea brasiliensis]
MLDPATKFPEINHVHFSNGRVTDSFSARNYGFRAQKTAQNYANYQTWNSLTEFEAERKLIDDDDSAVSSPPLWGTSPSRSPQHRQNHYRSLSPSSRAQAIARGQKELMEMVSRMPEGCYELSLKDIVEQNMVDQAKDESFSKERSITSEYMYTREKSAKKKNDKKVQMNRSGSIDNGGFLLKMVFPFSLGSRKKMKKNSNNNNNLAMNNSARDGRVSPKPLLLDGSAKGVENEWWKNRFSESGESESGGLSSNSGSSKSSGSSSSRSSSRNGSTRNGGVGCWSVIFRKRGKKTE